MKNSKTRVMPSGETLISAYLHVRANKEAIPLSGTFEITPRCNFSCRMCYVHENVSPSMEMSAKEWIELGRTARDAGMLFLLITGGEPLLRKDFPEIYTELRRLGLMVSINTNASLLTDELLDVLVKNAPTRVNVTLYGGSSETYRNLCRNDSFETVTRNIRRMKEAGLPVKINCSVTPYNAHDVEYIHKFAKELNIPVQSAAYMYPPVRVNGEVYGSAPDRFTAEDAAKYTLRCREQVLTPEQLAASLYMPVDEECCRDVGEPMACRAGRTAFWVTWDGKIMPCGTFPSSFSYDIRELGFLNAWQKIREDVIAIRMPKECAGCGKKDQCAICAASCMAETGSTTIKPEYICTMTHRLLEMTAEKYAPGGKENEAES